MKDNSVDFLTPHYNRDLPLLLPRFDEMRDIVVQMIPYDRDFPLTFLDLGAGSGSLTAAILEQYPNSKAICVAPSEQALTCARECLAPFPERVNYHTEDLNDYEALESIHDPLHLAISILVLHQLPHPRKRSLFAEIFVKLALGGALIVADEILSPSDHLQRFYYKRWDLHVQEQLKAGRLSAETESRWGEFVRENLGESSFPAQPGSHHRAGMGIQMKWLVELGYREVDCYWKYHHWSIFGGFRTA
ncbi:MAG: class I SAM-dependent methyltransferase [Candidatus Tectomicrobia bacterium]|uniref:Class I SAM-dependent methyltransferase n=1 Tax=Tectimicrobiota bacterium TaxID=2528274 RepID=A0A932M250_UNCTE|nr:class I SAM-dependent methyltransferase [Candidatus Tectomicrobia bacterium]